MDRPRYDRRERERSVFNIEAWQPKTELGRDVKERRVTSIEQVFHDGKRIEEPEIIEALLPDLNNEVIEIASVQRMTKNNRKQKFRATAIVGDGKGHVGVGSGKDVEVKAAIESAIIDAKSKVIPIIMGCGSWQCLCGTKHSLPIQGHGKMRKRRGHTEASAKRPWSGGKHPNKEAARASRSQGRLDILKGKDKGKIQYSGSGLQGIGKHKPYEEPIRER